MTSKESTRSESQNNSLSTSSTKSYESIDRLLSSLAELLRLKFSADLLLIREIEQPKSVNGEEACLVVRNLPGHTISYPTFTLRISFANGQTVRLEYSFSHES